MSSVLNQINQLLFPYVLGYISMNNGGDFVVTNVDCSQFRSLGGRKWQTFEFAPSDFDNHRLEVVKYDFLNSGYFNVDGFFNYFTKQERIESIGTATSIVEACKPYFLALRGDLQGQYHYCIAKIDPMVNIEQKVAFIFPGTVEDLWSELPKSETTNPSPMVGGSLGWLAHLTPFEKTLEGIAAAKKLLEG